MLKALRPCSFDGHRFLIGDTVPDSLVLDARKQEKWGVLKILPDEGEAGTAETPAGGTREEAQPAAKATRKKARKKAADDDVHV